MNSHAPSLTRRIGWALALAACCCALFTSSAQAVESGGIGGRPANPDPKNKRTESIFLFNVDPGATASNSVKIYNNTPSKKTIDVYAVDSQISSGGAFACAQRADERRDAGAWLTLDRQSVTVESNSNQDVSFSLKVPENATPGEHNGCIVIQQADQTPQAAGNGIALSFRSAIRVAITVSGDLKKSLAFTRLNVQHGTEKKEGKLLVNTALRNSGNVSLDTDVQTKIKSLFGTTVKESGGTFPVLAGGESEFNFEMDEPFWGGFYVLTADGTYNPDLKAGLGDESKGATISTKQYLVLTPKPLALVIELLALALIVGGIIWFVKHKRHKKHVRTTWQTYIVQDGEDIQAIADRSRVDWKKLARANKLKAPYLVKKGDRIRVPGPGSKKTVPRTSAPPERPTQARPATSHPRPRPAQPVQPRPHQTQTRPPKPRSIDGTYKRK